MLVVGRTGSGKSTLLGVVNGTVPHFSGGLLAGRVVVHGRDTRTHRPRDLADVVGVVGQDPLAGFVTDTVEEELAYAMEQLALPAAVMRKRVEETLDVLGIAELRDAPLRELSGGQQQRVAIGSVLTAHPRVLVLDEPTSALDPTGAEEVLAAITRLVHDLAVTVLVAEHRVERVLQYADRVVHVATDGTVTDGPPAAMMRGSDIAPPVVELGRWAGWDPLPLSVRDARRAGSGLRAALADLAPPDLSPPRQVPARSGGDRSSPSWVRARGVVVRHGDVVAVAGVDLDLRPGEVTALMGRNGAGKSSLLWALQGSGTRTSGTVRVGAGDGADPRSLDARARRAAVGLVPQSASDLLYLDTVAAECARRTARAARTEGTCAALLERIAPGADPALHPRDLSEGQRLALVLAVQLTAAPARAAARRAHPRPRLRRQTRSARGGSRPRAAGPLGPALHPRRRVRGRRRRPGGGDGRRRGGGRRPHRRGRGLLPRVRAAGGEGDRSRPLAHRRRRASGPPGRCPVTAPVATPVAGHGPSPAADEPPSVVRAIALRPRSTVAVALVSVAGVLAFGWPLLVDPGAALAHGTDAPLVFGLLLPLLMAVVLFEIGEGGLDVKALAMLGVLSAVGAALRPLGAGTAGLETVFFLLVLGGRVFGAGFGFVLGATTLFASALITGGVGPWLPFQMLGAAWVGLGAGLLPRASGQAEIALLAGVRRGRRVWRTAS